MNAKMNQSEAAIALGLHPMAFSHIKKNTPVLFRWIKIHGKGSLFNGMSMYQDNIEDTRAALATTFIELKECRALSRFYRAHKDVLHYTTAHSMIGSIEKFAFRATEQMPKFHSYRTARKIVRLYSQWKDITAEDRKKIEAMYEDAA